MGAFRALLWKEWRDVRGITAFCGVAYVVIAAAVIAFLREPPEREAALYLPLVGASLFLCVVASEQITREIDQERIVAAALLPGRLGRVWWAKSLVLLGAGAAFLLGAWLVALGLAWALDAPEVFAGLFWTNATVQTAAALLLAIAFSVQMGAAVTQRPVPAVFAGLALGVLTGFTAAVGWFVATWSTRSTGAFLYLGAAAFAAGSYLAFSHGRFELGRRLRPALLALSVPAALALIPAGAGLRAFAVDIDIEPGDPRFHVVDVDVSPDGEHVAVTVFRPTGQEDRNWRRPAVSRVWVVRIADGDVTEVPGFFVQDAAFLPTGRLRIDDVPLRSAFRTGTGLERVVEFDPQTGEAAVPDERRMVARAVSRSVAAPSGWRNDWARALRLQDGTIQVEWAERSIVRTLGREARLAPQPGVVLETVEDGARLVRRDLADGSVTALLESEAARDRIRIGDFSHDGRFVTIDVGRARRVIAVADGSTVAPISGRSPVSWLGRTNVLWDTDGERRSILDAETGEIHPVALPVDEPQMAGDRHFIAIDERSTSVFLFDLQGRLVRRLYGPDED